MENNQNKQEFELDVRHFIYSTLAQTSLPPTTAEVASHFNTSIATAEEAFDSLADAHQIALAPGSHSIWMAHPYSGMRTNYVTEVNGKKYWGN